MCFIVFTVTFHRIMSELRTLTCWLGVWQVGLRGQRLVRGRLGPVGGGQRQQRGQHRGEEAGAPHGVSSLLTWSLVTVEYRHAGHSVQVCTGRGSRHNWLVTAARCRNWSAATTPRCSLRHTGEQRTGGQLPVTSRHQQLTPGGSVTRHTSGFRLNLNIFFIGVSGR